MKRKRKFSEGLLDNEVILKNLKISVGETILDAGCGNGYMTKRFSRLAGDTGKVDNTSFGPPLEMRYSSEELRQKLSFNPTNIVDVGEYFYMQAFEMLK